MTAAAEPGGATVGPCACERDEDLLSRNEASEYLRRFHIRMKPATLARAWSVGRGGPPCRHIRGKPWYPRSDLRAWAEAQQTPLRHTRGGEPDQETTR